MFAIGRWLKLIFKRETPPQAPLLLSLPEVAEENSDLVKGWRLAVTMQRRTPLAWLRRHGEFASGSRRPMEVVPSEYGIWLPDLKTFKELGFDVPDLPPGTIASEIGQIPIDGGELLPFLIEYRQIIEAPISRVEQLSQIRNLEVHHAQLAEKLGGDLCRRYVTLEMVSLLGCGSVTANKLYDAGFQSADQVTAASIDRLCQISGIAIATARKLKGVEPSE
ncbi:conserved hypothetical protein [Hyphomicrobiales bacterium]|nr:conserved hypothetical protein [Hyphomicrobiales bacterium]CAH1664202.1 conserved hypothetical protein [Hyphomicrobiales bacterium]